MALLTYVDPDALIPRPAQPETRVEVPPGSDDDVKERWLQAQPWPYRIFARCYRALRKLQPMFPPMSCC
ncbi:hypothetical protein LPW26_08845 [Rhodopseudomonas sp. HC1]|uniref:hypothetical protein n=1 Tax=Rhodopseudomonas infernalis TaxID=2897386 RepID=UPI001EE91857|nr:hypothetical protein [Rhodopseudomonas infernalis]MCG6204741.1 hypothetical protein [Rhodopseudomonas infernalis]